MNHSVAWAAECWPSPGHTHFCKELWPCELDPAFFRPAAALSFYIAAGKDKRSPVSNSELIFQSILFKISRRSFLELKTEFVKKSCQFKVTDGFRHLKVSTSSPAWLSKAYQHTYISLIGSLLTRKFILDRIMEIPFLNVHFIVNFFRQIKTDLGSNY